MDEQKYYAETLPDMTKKQQIIMRAKETVASMIEKNNEGQLIYSIYVETESSPDRLEVRKIENENGVSYIYTAFRCYDEQPYYYAESDQLLPVFASYAGDSKEEPFISFANKNYTAYNGDGIGLFIGAQSYIQRNLVGIFKEYIDRSPDKTFHITYQSDPKNDYQIGFIRKTQDVDSIPLFTADFGRNEVVVVAEATIGKNIAGENAVNVMGTTLEEDGTIDYDKLAEYIKQNLKETMLIEGKWCSEEELDKMAVDILKKRAVTAQEVFYDIYDVMGLPIIEGVERKPLFGVDNVAFPRLEDKSNGKVL